MAYEPRLLRHMSRFHWGGGGFQYIDSVAATREQLLHPLVARSVHMDQGAPKERRRGRAEKRLSRRVFLESPFLLWSLKVFQDLSAVLRANLKGAEKKRTLQKHPFGQPFLRTTPSPLLWRRSHMEIEPQQLWQWVAIDLLMGGLFRGAVFCDGGVPKYCPLALMGRFPS